RVGDGAPQVGYVAPWHALPGFVEAQADLVTAALAAVPAAQRRETPLLFTAHSIPMSMAHESAYAEEVATSARLVAQRFGRTRWQVAYQSRSGDPRDPWLEPDVGETVRTLAREGAPAVVVVPIGFVCDHIEVLYDLDIEARRIADGVGIAFHRAGTVMDHPAFVGMLSDLVRAQADR
ncbi:MAG TPA: ferrochelatase, partial [Candidatus Acidoferrales bacterium]|nr:ferrochelatase [Candidatus Acidoferrales bacterium]